LVKFSIYTMRYLKFNYILALAAGLLLTTACCRDCDDIQPPPEDSAPIISISDPTHPYTLARTGDVVQITYQAHDNELLDLFYITEKRTDPNGIVYQAETQIMQSAISTVDHEEVFNYTVPTTPVYYCTIEIMAYAKDNKGRIVSVKFIISVIPPAGTGSTVSIQSFDDSIQNPNGDTIWMGYTGLAGPGHKGSHYDIFNHRCGDDLTMSNVLDRHLSEVSPTLGSPVAAFQSPYWMGADSVLVHTSSALFDFENLTWETTWQAWMSSNAIGDQAGPTVDAGDVVILKLNTPSLHFAVFKIEGVEVDNTNPANNYVRFNYKYTY
jgi:hypothetical protein